jgi:hypothetical protein
MKEQRDELQKRLREVRDKRLAEMGISSASLPLAPRGGGPGADRFRLQKVAQEFKQQKAAEQFKPKPPIAAKTQSAPTSGAVAAKTQGATSGAAAAKAQGATSGTAAVKPAVFQPVDHPLLYDLENKSLRDLQHIVHELFFPITKRQQNMQIGEMALIEITIDPTAATGDRELRLETPQGLTNPMVFEVGLMPEARELEPNDPRGSGLPPNAPNMPRDLFANPRAPAGPNNPPILPKDPPVELPVVLNGQIMPGDVDRFPIRAKKGQQLVMTVHARHLIPYLADAVPGWFQATLALYDAKGKELAFDDDYRFDPDPVLFYRIPADGVYELEIRDSIYRGREDFVYRVAVGEQPFITQAFPLGGHAGAATVAAIGGWNLSQKQLALDTQPGDASIRKTVLRTDKSVSNDVTYAVDSLPECVETEPNDTVAGAQKIAMPLIINGRIAKPGDVDVFQITGRAGDQVAAEVYGRRLNSPLDSLLRLTDASGVVLKWNDDYDEKDGDLRRGEGLLTHHADSYLMARLPKDGAYYVHLADTQQHGGEAYGYRLRVTPAQPDFALRLNPSSINIPPGGIAVVTVHALRKDGFSGDIELALKNAPAGFALSGARIPAGRDRVRMTLAAPVQPTGQPIVLQLEGRAQVNGTTVTRPVAPVEDMMQAFLWRHLTPSRQLMVWVRKAPFRPPSAELAESGPVRIPEGGTAEVRIRTPKAPAQRKVQFELREPPAGVTLQEVKVEPTGLALQLKADGEKAKAGLADNLIVEAFTENAPPVRPGAPAVRQVQRQSLGVLPAIAFEVVRR